MKAKMKIIVIVAFTPLALAPASAQLWNIGDISKQGWNVGLRDIKVGDVVVPEYIGGFHGAHDAVLASSWLAAEGTPPRPIKYRLYAPEENDRIVIDENGERRDKDEVEWENTDRYNCWAAMYAAGSCTDGKTDTAWCEGVEGDGIGEVVIAKVDIEKPVKIWAGFGRSQSIWEKNNRPKDIEVYILKGENLGENVNDKNYRLTAVAKKRLTLSDMNGWQPLDLSGYEGFRYGRAFGKEEYDFNSDDESFIAIKILSVYRGTKYRDTLITEISN